MTPYTVVRTAFRWVTLVFLFAGVLIVVALLIEGSCTTVTGLTPLHTFADASDAR